MRPDIIGALDAFDEMVEALEENEDMVECKECFDLFPKTDCEKSEVGYVCPVCKGLRAAPARTDFVDPYDCYTQDFPEVKDYNPDSLVDYEREPDLGDALSDLIKDEYEAIDGYEIADETIQKAEIEEEEKDEILDTLDHIKEEEEEHIDELKELCPECDDKTETEVDKKTEDDLDELFDANVSLSLDGGEGNDVSVLSSHDPKDKGSEKLAEDAAEDPEEPEDAEDTEESEEDSESEDDKSEELDLEAAYTAAIEVANETGVGQVFGYAKKDTEEFVAIDLVEVDDPEAIEQDLEAVYDDMSYAYVAFPEKTLEESLFESVQLHEANFFTGEDKYLNKLFGANGYVIKVRGQDVKHTAPTYKEAEKLAIKTSKAFPNSTVDLYGAAMSPEDYNSQTPEIKQLLAKNGVETVIAVYDKGKAKQVDKAAELTKAMKNITKYQKAVGNSTDAKAAAKAEAEAGAEAGASAYEANATEADVAAASETTDNSKARDNVAVEPEGTIEDGDKGPEEEVEIDTTSITAENFELVDNIFKNGYAYAIDNEGKPYQGGTSCEALIKKLTTVSKSTSEKQQLTYYLLAKTVEADSFEKNGSSILSELNVCVKDIELPKVLSGYKGKYYLVATIKAGGRLEAKNQDLLERIGKKADMFNELLSGEDVDSAEADNVTSNEEDELKNQRFRAINRLTEIKSFYAETQADYTEESWAAFVKECDALETQINSSKDAKALEKFANDYEAKKLRKLLKLKPKSKDTSSKETSDESSSASESSDETGEATEPASINVKNAKMSAKNIAKILRKAGIPLSKKQNRALRDLLGESMNGSIDSLNEEYHKYANPAELAAMEKIEIMIADALNHVYNDLTAWGYTAEEVDGQSFMCSENEACLQHIIVFENLDPDEAEDLAEQIQNTLENTAKDYKCPAEIQGIDVSVALPDYDLEDEDDAAQGITRASFLFYVTFARNLF